MERAEAEGGHQVPECHWTQLENAENAGLMSDEDGPKYIIFGMEKEGIVQFWQRNGLFGGWRNNRQVVSVSSLADERCVLPAPRWLRIPCPS